MKKMLLLGGMGFVGKNIIESLHSKYSIIVVDRILDNSFVERYSSMIEARYQTDLIKEDKIYEIINQHQPEIVINLVSVVTAERDLRLFPDMIEKNLNVLLRLYDALKSQQTLEIFIQFGSCEEYGAISSPLKESDRERPNSPYALVKQLTTNTTMMLYENFRFPALVVRPSNIFGPYQENSKFIPYVVSKLIKNEDLHLTKCEQKRDFIYVKDLIRYLDEIIQFKESYIGKIINVGFGRSYPLKEIVEYLKQIINSESHIIYGALPYRANEIMDLLPDLTLLHSKIQWRPQSFYENLKSYVEILKIQKER
jgi:UDP-glucose 4-epimerase